MPKRLGRPVSEVRREQNRFTLSFIDSATEQAYQATTRRRLRVQGGLALATGVPIYIALGVLDQWFVPAHLWPTLWTIRGISVFIALALYALTYTNWRLARNVHPLLALTGFVAGGSLLAIFFIVPPANISLYYGGIILATFYTYNLTGVRFTWALAVDVALILGYNLIFMMGMQYPVTHLLVHDFFMISSNLVGGAAGYWTEFQTRRLFLRERELEQERERHRIRSLHDPLTGLANRDLLHDRIDQALAHAQREGSHHAGFFIDLDGFKRINDQLGHDAGDATLKAIASRLSSHARTTDTVARLGGDEFFVLGYGVESLDLAKRFAERFSASIKQPIEGIPSEFPLSASIGICLFPYEGATVTDVMRRADLAMYEAKRGGKDRISVAQLNDRSSG
jgi:diguanylate cyclase